MTASYVIRPETTPKVSWKELWRARNMFANLVAASALRPYTETYFGPVWALGRPFVFLAAMIFIKRRSGGNMFESIPYPLFLYTGLILWWYIVDAIKQSSRSPATYRGLITKIYFPRIIAPAVAVTGRLFDLAIQSVGIVAMMIWYGRYPDAKILLLPLVILNVFVLCLGLGYLLSIASVLFRDVERVVDYILYVGLFLSPVLYAVRLIPEEYRGIYSFLNPAVGPLMMFRAALFADAPADYGSFAHSLAVSFVVLAVGAYVYQRVQSQLAERM